MATQHYVSYWSDPEKARAKKREYQRNMTEKQRKRRRELNRESYWRHKEEISLRRKAGRDMKGFI